MLTNSRFANMFSEYVNEMPVLLTCYLYSAIKYLLTYILRVRFIVIFCK